MFISKANGEGIFRVHGKRNVKTKHLLLMKLLVDGSLLKVLSFAPELKLHPTQHKYVKDLLSLD